MKTSTLVLLYIFILLGLLSTPLDSIVFLLQASVRDLVDVLLTTWNDTYNPANIDFSVFTNIWIWGFAGLVGLTSWIFFTLIPNPKNKEKDQRAWARALIFLGLIFVILSLLPTWISGRTFFDIYDLFDDRFALPAMFGASMVWVGGIFYLVKKQTHSYIIISILLGLALGLQLRTNTKYSESWDKQSRFYWQLYWRAPYIEPDTAFISDGEIFMYMGTHPTVYAINTLYDQNEDIQKLNYSFFPSGKHVGAWDEFREGVELEDTRFGSSFKGSSKNSLTIFFAPEKSQCLWILQPEDKRIRSLPVITYESLPLSNISRIAREPLSDQYPPEDIFGTEPPHRWCYFYEKAELAQQYEEFAAILQHLPQLL